MDIIEILNNNAFQGQNNPRFVILHATAGGTSATAIAQYFQTVQVSAHYVIGQDGQIVRCNNEQDGAWGNGIISGTPATLPFRDVGDGIHRDYWWGQNGINPNNESISIEHCKPSLTNSDELTPAQKTSSFALIKDICQRHSIPMRFADENGGIIGHLSIDGLDRAHCPGPYPWTDLFNYLATGQQEDQPMSTIDLSNPTVASHFVAAANGAWHCPSTNATIGGEILATYQRFGSDALNGLTYWGLPLTGEIATGKPGTVYQRFERVVVAFDPNKIIDGPPGAGRVYLMHIDKGIGQDPQVATLQAQITALKLQPNVANLLAINTLASQIVQKSQVQ